MFCPKDAIVETSRPVGSVEIGKSDRIAFVQGLLSIGQINTPAVIAAVKGAAGDREITLLGLPAGTVLSGHRSGPGRRRGSPGDRTDPLRAS